MADVSLSVINVVAELERVGWDFSFAGDDEVKCRCPAHADDRASASINTEKRLWKCHAAGCLASGDFVSFLQLALKEKSRVVVVEYLSKYYKDLYPVKVLNVEEIESHHEAIWKCGLLLKELYKRAVTDDMIRKYRLGEHKNRITIPIPNERGLFVNERSYLPGAPGNMKMRNKRGHGRIRLFPIEQLKFDRIVVCGGEVKSIATAERVNQYDIGALCATAGEGNWQPEFSKLFKDKQVYVCLDVDAAGRNATNMLCARLKGHARWVGDVSLPLDIDKYPAGDLNDYFGPEEKTPEEFVELLDNTTAWKPKSLEDEVLDEDVRHLVLVDSTKAEHAGRRVAVVGIISAMDTTPYLVPREVRCDCDRNQPYCMMCPVFARTPHDDGFVDLTINPESPAILEMVGSRESVQHDAIRKGLRIPPCKSVSFKVLAHYNVEDLRITPQLEIGSHTSDGVMIPAMSISHGLEMNTGYNFEGRTHPHPKTQQATLLISKSKATDDSLSKYTPTEEELELLTVFQPSSWTVESLGEKLDELYEDLESNVTRIYKRRDLHLAMDLAYHSTLVFYFDKRLEKGWAEILILGDSSQGKTETSKQLMEHYRLGEKVECKNASIAGLLGGLQQLGNRWFVTWGIIPMHDRRLVVLEELKGASLEVIGSLTDMRSSGVAEIPKIEKRRTHARTRLIALSNPRSDMPLSSYNYGVDALRELIGSPEDIRRFDLSLVLATSEIDPGELNVLSRHRPKVDHKHTSDLCHSCVLFAWTRTQDQIEFTESATDLILSRSTELCTKFSDVVPLVDRGSVRLKVARLSVALAARTFSTGRSLQVIVVRPCHVDYVVQFIDRTYSSPVFGYADFSSAYLSTRVLVDGRNIGRKILATPFPRDFIEQMLYASELELRDICDWCGWDKSGALDLLSYLVRKHALYRMGRSYRKSPEFIDLLKKLQGSDDLKVVDRPEHLKEEEF